MTQLEVKKKVYTIIGNLLSIDSHNINEDNFFQFCSDSITFVQLVVLCEEEFQFEFDIDKIQFENFGSLESFMTYIIHKLCPQ